MRARDWINAIWRQAASLREPPENPGIARWKKALSDFGYPFDLISAASADDALSSTRTVGRHNGFVPVIIVPGGWNSTRIAPSKRVRRAREILQEAECDAAYGRQFLTDGWDSVYLDHEIDPGNPNPDDFDKLQQIEIVTPGSGLSIVKGWDQVAIVRVPAASTEELPVYFEWGGWNATPEPETIVAVARHWRETYGAELVAMGSDVLEFYAPRKPPDHLAAIALLKEQYVFAADSFEVMALEIAAAEVRASSSWVFWWD
jgi:hypothetical protein